MPLFDAVSVEARRFAAAALSECEYAPRALVQRLCNDRVDIAAPLLIRSRLVKDVDLIALIGRHGLPHARAIARRPNLNPAIADLIRALDNSGPVRLSGDSQGKNEKATQPDFAKDTESREHNPGTLAEDARQRLRSMMLPSREEELPAGNLSGSVSPYAKLRDTALMGNSALFQTVLADAAGIDFRAAKSMAEIPGNSILMAALRSFELSEERAFLICAALFPGSFADPTRIRRFLEAYRALAPDAARERVKAWERDIASVPSATNRTQDAAANQAEARLKAS
ncbi:hypothetical protein [Mesorhizobium sp. KR1-2]|uniref:hypothetical protein n=1 Tax=Mesorhizobium sp. KR1-2 TaxID=3156609 RepID=UPI0032B4111B